MKKQKKKINQRRVILWARKTRSIESITQIIIQQRLKINTNKKNKKMRHRYITKQILLAFKPKSLESGKDIHAQLEETIAERRTILPEWERSFLADQPGTKKDIPAVKKDIHEQLAETIAEYKRIRKQWENSVLFRQEHSFLMQNKEAA